MASLSTSEARSKQLKRSRGAYSRVICLGCRARRIRCELPSEVELPAPGELRTVETPCYRCKRLDIPCVVRQTALGRARLETGWPGGQHPADITVGDLVLRAGNLAIEFPSRTATRPWTGAGQHETQQFEAAVISETKRISNTSLPNRRDFARCNANALHTHHPTSAETVVIIRALDTIRCEHVEDTWPRHLPAHVGRTPALDLSIKAIVAACAYARGTPHLTLNACHQALAVALHAVQAHIEQPGGKPNDDVLASTALLAPFEGVVTKHDTPARVHIEGMAAILAARPANHPVSQLARDIVDFYVCDSAVIACVQRTPSAFESINPAYFANNMMGYGDCDRAQMKALGTELFIRTPQLARLVGSWRAHLDPPKQLLLDTAGLLESLLRLQDPEAEARLLRTIKICPSSGQDAILSCHQSLQFASVEEFEALTYYWQGQLSLLRLEWVISDLTTSSDVHGPSTDEPNVAFPRKHGPRATKGISRLVMNILMSLEYAGTLRLRKRRRLFAHTILVVWGVAMDIPLTFEHSQGIEHSSLLFDLLLRMINVALATKPELSSEDMDIAADILVGGEPRGRYAELYGL